MGRFGTGQAIRRVEDQRFLTGTGRYTDDVTLPNQAVGYVVRSPYPHADLTAVDVEAARQAPGVLAVYTAADLAADGLGDMPVVVRPKAPDGSRMVAPPHPVLARDRLRFVGEPVAFVVAETLDQARDAGEMVMIDAEPLDHVIEAPDAWAEGAPQLWPDAPRNQLLRYEQGDAAATDAAFAQAAHVVAVDLVNQRLAPTPLEPRGCIGDYDSAAAKYTLITGSQGSHTLRGYLKPVLGFEDDAQMHVVAPDVGGGFGMRLFLFSEHALVCYAARKTGRPVKWIADRSEGFLADTHGRDHVSHAELALDGDGRFLGLRVETLANIGAYASQMGGFVPTMAGSAMLSGVYDIPAAFVGVRVLATNTAPVDAYRGAGRPEAAYLIERLVDCAAFDTGIPRDEIRRRNFVQPEAMPYRTVLGNTYDSGDFPRLLAEALKRADWDGFAARRAESEARGKLRGLGLSYYVEIAGGGGDETATLSLDADGRATVLIGSQSTGQGHETAYGQMVAGELGLPLQDVRVVQGDTEVVPTGKGTGGSRSLPVGGASLSQAIDQVVARGKAIAAGLLQATVEEVRFEAGRFVVGNRHVGFAEVARAAFAPEHVPEGGTPGLSETAAWKPPAGTFPNGAHLCEVEIDPETGEHQILRYTVVDDVGVVVNPLLLRGQIVGGVAQGVGQALYEHCVYDRESGQLLTGTMMDYAMPRADTLPHVDFTNIEIPCATNLLGIKGAGEAGTIGATPAAMNAVLDALRPLGVRHIDMPATPQVVWRAVQDARKETAA